MCLVWKSFQVIPWIQMCHHRCCGQNRRQKIFNRGLCVSAGEFCFCARRLDIKKLTKLHWFIVFHVSIWGGWSCLRGISPPKPPRGDGTGCGAYTSNSGVPKLGYMLPLGVHLPIWRGTNKLTIEGKICLYIIDFELCIHISVNIIFKNHYVLIGKYIFIIFLSLFLIKNFRGTCSSVKMLKGYMARESLGNPALTNMQKFSFHVFNSFIEFWPSGEIFYKRYMRTA